MFVVDIVSAIVLVLVFFCVCLLLLPSHFDIVQVIDYALLVSLFLSL